LTGRENIFLNGSIMGMSRPEVQRKFDQIVAFAEVERFIDTPIKFYSSGMQMRLGFAVAAHTDPDVLLIDEILAVGDASFQAKCLNKLAELKDQGKTIILVSHHLTNITDHSTKVLWIDRGTVRMVGETDAVVDAYLAHVSADMKSEDTQHEARDSGGDRPISIVDVAVLDAREEPQTCFDRGDTAHIDIAYTASRPIPGVVFGVTVHDIHGLELGGVITDPDSVKVTAPVDQGVLRLTLGPLLFVKGVYTLNIHVIDAATKRHYALRRRALRLVVEGHHASSGETVGHVYYPHQWGQIK
ncbi:MAG TPA: Wzt carbohydrate-binding domain-containing protein, partial [Terriglobales bacterium]|nr:Wzt carbohydrate-binding domain-containing protein [Terriglobales bacterium]